MEKYTEMTLNEIIENIDLSKTESYGIDLYDIGEEFQIYDNILYQQENNIRLTYCFYHSWTCTDTKVGLKLWLFDNKPVCVSWKLYRKSKEIFKWVSVEDFENVRIYLESLRAEDKKYLCNLLTDNDLSKVIKDCENVDFKKYEKYNIK